MRFSGGRTSWAHLEFTRINIEPIILKNKIEEQLMLGAIYVAVGSKDLHKSLEGSPARRT